MMCKYRGVHSITNHKPISRIGFNLRKPVVVCHRDTRGGKSGRGRAAHNPGNIQGDAQNKPFLCYNCGKEGHYSGNCDQPKQPRRATVYQQSKPATSPDVTSVKLNTVTHKTAIQETCMEVQICSQTHKCLLDTGCDHSIIPRKLVPTAILEPAPVDVTAANGSAINVLGHMTINFSIQAKPLQTDLLVADDVDEFMLGFDWLTA